MMGNARHYVRRKMASDATQKARDKVTLKLGVDIYRAVSGAYPARSLVRDNVAMTLGGHNDFGRRRDASIWGILDGR